jgi:hypothetical protein
MTLLCSANGVLVGFFGFRFGSGGWQWLMGLNLAVAAESG